MSGKKIAFWIWTTFVVAVGILCGISVTRDRVYTGTMIEFSTSRDLQIKAEKVTFEAASSNFFVLHKESGETIVGVPAQRPLGWSQAKYFVVTTPQEISGGEWLFAEGTATVKITSEKAVTVHLVLQSPGLAWFMVVLGAFIVWALGLMFASM